MEEVVSCFRLVDETDEDGLEVEPSDVDELFAELAVVLTDPVELTGLEYSELEEDSGAMVLVTVVTLLDPDGELCPDVDDDDSGLIVIVLVDNLGELEEEVCSAVDDDSLIVVVREVTFWEPEEELCPAVVTGGAIVDEVKSGLGVLECFFV